MSKQILITGGAGFIGSHLAERLLERGDQVVILDDLSTGRFSNLAAIEENPNLRVIIGSVTETELVEPLIRECDEVYHLASAVGVRLIMERPVETVETIVLGTDVVLKLASRYRRKVLLTSTSEVYGKSSAVPFQEDGDRLEGPTSLHRWAYACAKALDEFLALAHHKKSGLPVVVVRLFNTVGPRQSGQYGMVIPNFVEAALRGHALTVHGDGDQTRCFAHVLDVVGALVGVMSEKACVGKVINIGSSEEVSIRELAERIIRHVGSTAGVETIPYDQAFPDGGFEDMRRRVPSIERIRSLTGWTPRRSLDDIIRDVVADRSAALGLPAAESRTVTGAK